MVTMVLKAMMITILLAMTVNINGDCTISFVRPFFSTSVINLSQAMRWFGVCFLVTSTKRGHLSVFWLCMTTYVFSEPLTILMSPNECDQAMLASAEGRRTVTAACVTIVR